MKFEQRRNVRPKDVHFKAAQILVLTAMDIETRVIGHYGSEWNGSGFGSNDPGRERETTDKPEQGFDARFPIDIDIPLEILTPGRATVHQTLMALKEALPYTLRYEVSLPPSRKKVGPHEDAPFFQVARPLGRFDPGSISPSAPDIEGNF